MGGLPGFGGGGATGSGRTRRCFGGRGGAAGGSAGRAEAGQHLGDHAGRDAEAVGEQVGVGPVDG
ncbi:hypothetical protein AB0B27_28830, partial [Micromonospora rifamycinica]